MTRNIVLLIRGSNPKSVQKILSSNMNRLAYAFIYMHSKLEALNIFFFCDRRIWSASHHHFLLLKFLFQLIICIYVGTFHSVLKVHFFTWCHENAPPHRNSATCTFILTKVDNFLKKTYIGSTPWDAAVLVWSYCFFKFMIRTKIEWLSVSISEVYSAVKPASDTRQSPIWVPNVK